jgi:hypothetical protein
MVLDVEKARFDRLKIGRHFNACRTDSLSEMAFAMELDGEEETGVLLFPVHWCNWPPFTRITAPGLDLAAYPKKCAC